MTLEEKIEKEFKESLKARDNIKLSTLRMLKTEINNFKLDKNKKALSNDEIIKIIQSQIRKHNDSIEQFAKGNRPDLVEKEKKELDILMTYMPEQLSPEELKKIIEEAVKELGANTKKDMGRVMKTVMEKVKGRAEGKTVSQIVSNMLG